jgi:signal transduction histidine kinase
LLEMGIPEPVSESTLERINRMRQSAGHLLYLIDQLLAYARVEGHHEQVKRDHVDVTRVVREVGELMEPLAAAKQLELRVDVPAEEIRIVSDADKLRQILVNLVGNAVKYTHAGHVAIRVSAVDEQHVTLRVDDTGVGIAADQLPHIFEPFWQADRSQRTADGGTGLGLSVVQRVVELLAGKVWVESEPGRGSSFYLSVPRVFEAASA